MTLFVELIVYHNEHSRTIRNASVRNPTAMFLPVYAVYAGLVKRHVICHATALPVGNGTVLLPGALGRSEVTRNQSRDDRGEREEEDVQP